MSVLASNTAFIPLELSTCLQNLQHRMDTQRSLKVQLLVDIASHVERGTEFGKGGNRSSFDSPRLTTKLGGFEFSKALKSGRQFCFPDGKVKLVFIGWEEQTLVPFDLAGRGEGNGIGGGERQVGWKGNFKPAFTFCGLQRSSALRLPPPNPAIPGSRRAGASL